jgi:hypothetical protein
MATAESLLGAEERGVADPEAVEGTGVFDLGLVLNAVPSSPSAGSSDGEAGGGESAEEGGEGEAAGGRKAFTRFCASRVLWKACIALLLYAGYTWLHLIEHLEDASAYIETLPPDIAFLMFLLMSTTFTALSPTGYLPTVLAGVVFPARGEAWLVAYLQVNMGALLNAVLVRECCRPLAQRLTRRRFGTFHWLNNALRQPGTEPARIVALIRTPFLWGGFFNCTS